MRHQSERHDLSLKAGSNQALECDEIQPADKTIPSKSQNSQCSLYLSDLYGSRATRAIRIELNDASDKSHRIKSSGNTMQSTVHSAEKNEIETANNFRDAVNNESIGSVTETVLTAILNS